MIIQASTRQRRAGAWHIAVMTGEDGFEETSFLPQPLDAAHIIRPRPSLIPPFHEYNVVVNAQMHEDLSTKIVIN